MAASSCDPSRSFKLSVTILDCYSFRGIMDILRGYRDKIYLRFSPKGIEIIECGTSETSIQHYTIFGDELLSYEYPLRDKNGEFIPLYVTDIQATDAFSTLKVDSKKEPITIYTDIDPVTLRNTGLYVTRQSASTTLQSVNYISTGYGSVSAPSDYVNFYDTVYKDRKPNSKVPTAAFVKTFSNIKARGCNIVSFELRKRGVIIVKGKHDNKVMTASPLPFDDIDGVDDEEESEEDDLPLELEGMVLIEDEPSRYSINLTIAHMLWFIKISRLATTSILKIYLSQDSPLVMRTNLGLYGIVTFSFTSDVK